VPLLRARPGPVLVSLKVSNEIPPVFPRVRDGVWFKCRFRQALLGHL